MLDVHEALDRLFAGHQEALLDRDVGKAARALAEFESGIREHIELEENELLPIYERAGSIPGGGTKLYVAEHRKMLAHLVRFRSLLEDIDPAKPDAQAIIALFDEEARFKQLMDHHDLRERNILYPVLNRVSTNEEKQRLS